MICPLSAQNNYYFFGSLSLMSLKTYRYGPVINLLDKNNSYNFGID